MYYAKFVTCKILQNNRAVIGITSNHLENLKVHHHQSPEGAGLFENYFTFLQQM